MTKTKKWARSKWVGELREGARFSRIKAEEREWATLVRLLVAPLGLMPPRAEPLPTRQCMAADSQKLAKQKLAKLTVPDPRRLIVEVRESDLEAA